MLRCLGIQPHLKAEEFLEGIVEPKARGRAAKQMIVRREEPPHSERLLRIGALAQRLHRDALAVQHPQHIVVWQEEKRGRIREARVRREPASVRVSMRAQDR
jgi:hypothetical protein